MAYRKTRYSRTAPSMLSLSEQREWLQDLAETPGLMKDIEAVAGIPLEQMTDQEKLVHMSRFLRMGHNVQAFNESARAIEQLELRAAGKRADADLATQLQAAQELNEELYAENARLRGQEVPDERV